MIAKISKAQAKFISQAFFISVFNQMMSSSINFVLGIYLVRTLTPAEFGLYNISFAICLFFTGMGSAMLLTQMVVFTPDRAPEDQPRYAACIFVLVIAFCIATLLFLNLIFFFDNLLCKLVIQHTYYIAVAAASVACLLKEFFIRYAYNIRKEIWALFVNGSLAIFLIIMLWIQNFYSSRLTIEKVLSIYAAAHLCAVIVGQRLVRLQFRGITKRVLLVDFREAWQGGRWACLTNLVYFARIHAHTFIVMILIGPMGVATLNAARLLVTPAAMLTPAISQILMPRLATLRAYGSHKVTKVGLIISMGLLILALIYSTVLLSAYEYIIPLIIGNNNYPDLFIITLWWCGYVCILGVRNGSELSNQVLKKFKYLSFANSVSAIVSLVATYALTVIYNLTGAQVGLLIGEIVLIGFLWIKARW